MSSAPRRRTSTAVHDRSSVELPLEEQREDRLSQNILTSEDATKKGQSDHRNWGLVKLASLSIVSFILCVLLLERTIRLSNREESLNFNAVASEAVLKADSGTEFLAIQLHPEEHIYREPKTIYYDWSVASGFRSPDGVKKRVYLINGKLLINNKANLSDSLVFLDAFPGPTIEARTGDTIIVVVQNDLKGEGLSMHWHGLYMRGFNDMDGAVGFTQSPISPGESFTYNFTILGQSGTFWYHAHSHVQRGDGLYGGLVVHDPVTQSSTDAVGDEVLLLVSDWFHRSAETMLDWYTSVRGFGNEVSQTPSND